MIAYLERFDFDYKSLANIDKISAYMKMISESQRSPLLIIDKEIDTKKLSKKEEVLFEQFENNLFEISIGNKQGIIPYYPWFLSYTSYDWYFLLRVQIFELYETEECLWAADWSEDAGPEMPVIVGRKLAFLLDSMRSC